MTPDWTLSTADLAPGPPRAQTCPRCKLVYRRLRFERVTADDCPMCNWRDAKREEREQRERLEVAR